MPLSSLVRIEHAVEPSKRTQFQQLNAVTIEGLMAKYRSGDGFVLYTSVTDQQRQELSRAIDALSKEVSQVQGAIAFQ